MTTKGRLGRTLKQMSALICKCGHYIKFTMGYLKTVTLKAHNNFFSVTVHDLRDLLISLELYYKPVDFLKI